MTVVRMLADDLTGAVDTICPFATVVEPIPVFWHGGALPPLSGSFAVNTETREVSDKDAVSAVADLLPTLDGADIAFKKLDSLLRGHSAGEIAACLNTGVFASTVIAPAFPDQGRITRNGRQIVLAGAGGGLQELECDLGAELRALGFAVQHAKCGDAVTESGIFVCDAETNADLESVVAAGRALTPPILWCGSSGLARALSMEKDSVCARAPAMPLLMIIGSNHPSSVAQVDALRTHRPELLTILDLATQNENAQSIELISHRLDQGLSSTLAFRFTENTNGIVASQAISTTLSNAVKQLSRPGSVLVTGGDTLLRFVGATGADSLLVSGELTPGVPVSHLSGGLWDSLTVISKSGAFGTASFLCNLLEQFEENSHAVT